MANTAVPDDLGTCTLSPDEPAVAGAFGTWTLTYTAGRAAILPGGGIAVAPPFPVGIRWRVGHVVTSTTGACGVSLRVRHGYPLTYHHAQFPIIFATVQGGRLNPGEQIRVVLGDPGAFVSGFFERARAQERAVRGAAFQVAVDPLGNGDYSNPAYPGGQPRGFRLLPELPRIDVVAGPPRRLAVKAPTRLAAGEPFYAIVTAEDEYGNVCTTFEGEITLGAWHGTLQGAATARFTMADAGTMRVGPLRLEWAGDGPACVTAVGWEYGLAGVSNPVESLALGGALPGEARAAASAPPVGGRRTSQQTLAAGAERIFWGDLHAHAHETLGNPPAPQPFAARGLGTFEGAYAYARDVAGLDFIALAWFPRPRPEEWAGYQAITQRVHEPGRFVPFETVELQYRSTGHRNVVFPGDGSPQLAGGPVPELWQTLGGTGAIAIPHHPNATSEGGPQNWNVQDWRTHNPAFQPIAEISQSRGAFETNQPGGATLIGGGGASVQDALAMGCRVGFIGGSDNLYGQPGTNYTPQGGADYHDHVTGGVTAVFASELTREAVLAALKARRCYATTGARIILDFRVDGQPMGEEFATAAPEVRITARAAGTAPIARLEVLRNNAVVHAESHGPSAARTAALDVTLPLAVPAGTGTAVTWFYLRVTQTDGQVAWASPVWVDRTPGTFCEGG